MRFTFFFRGSLLSPVPSTESKFTVKLMEINSDTGSIAILSTFDSDNFQATDHLLLVKGVSEVSTPFLDENYMLFGF